ncbi:N-acetylneuraminate synthase family protein [Trinickia sp. EG282A]|uniref:N-acetylneuraminate synthase family protein n=1 Tax=Trinickia sp. EG282A TaxID=3237013 RepID=UPI0034D30713
MKYDSSVIVNRTEIAIDKPSYFVADIASNHDGDLERAKALIWLAKQAGADAVKFQHFKAEKIVSDVGFRSLGGQASHQAAWNKPVFDIFRENECNREWNGELVATAAAAGIAFMTTPYDVEAVEQLDPHLPAYKIGSGDITWTEFIEYVASRGKPVFVATGASDMGDVERAVGAVLKRNRQLVLMQCNTNYTGSLDNFRYINLRVLQSYATKYPGMILGLSDHSPGHATVLGAIALGARVIEKHFTDDCSRVGPDHGFSMNPTTWREMVDRSRELEASLGDGIKRIEANERETAVLQQRCLRLLRDAAAGEVLSERDLEVLRPAPLGALKPYETGSAIGARLAVSRKRGEALMLSDLEAQ